jgi:hypothetical protein
MDFKNEYSALLVILPCLLCFLTSDGASVLSVQDNSHLKESVFLLQVGAGQYVMRPDLCKMFDHCKVKADTNIDMCILIFCGWISGTSDCEINIEAAFASWDSQHLLVFFMPWPTI